MQESPAMGLLAPALLAVVCEAAVGAALPPQIFVAPKTTYAELLAAREVQRYVYLRTGTRPEITEAPRPPDGTGILIARREAAVAIAPPEASLEERIRKLTPQAYLLTTIDRPSGELLLVVGGDATGTLYGAYRLAEHLGVRFYLHGDVVPDERIAFRVPRLDETGTPLFELRGIQPFHDFPEGPDWWNADDYKAIVSQLPKLGMNFLGLHTYPEGGPNAEPTVWIGLPADVREDGRVAFSYPSSYQSTMRGNWGYHPKPTGQYSFGADALFDRDCFSAAVMGDACPVPTTPEACNQVFDRTAAMLREVFEHAHRLGIKTCVGTETPLIVPRLVQERLRAQGRDPADPEVIRDLYRGIFQRIVRAYPIDYYWLWTPEGWTWSGVTDEVVRKTIDDMLAAVGAAEDVKAPFALATCGWVLGPQSDRALFDTVLPKTVSFSCINRMVGMEPVEPGFARVHGRGKWAIPWLEDDPALTSPQLWVGRMRMDAYDALRYGCNGLMGIHWRTRILGPNVAALARAAWNQKPWADPSVIPPEPPKTAGAIGGAVADYPNNPIEGTEDDRIYQCVRYNLTGYRLAVPEGTYTVTLKFCEPHYGEKGKRVFDVSLQGRRVIRQLDIFATVGKNRALDYTYRDVHVADGWLEVEFRPRVEFPSIAGIVVEGPGYSQKINCGGPAWKDYAADLPPVPGRPRDMPVKDFYADWATSEFGPEAPEIAEVFSRIDGKLPRPSDWVDGPGGLRPDARPWEQIRKDYAFVDELEALRPRIRGPGARARFDYWLGQFRYMRTLGQIRCVWGRYEALMEAARSEKDAARKKQIAREALPLRKEIVRLYGQAYGHILPTVSNTGELGTIANLEQHVMPMLLANPGKELAKALGEPLPADAEPARGYHGPTTVIVPTVRSTVGAQETLRLRVIILSQAPVEQADLHWRPMGRGPFARVPLRHVARGVYAVDCPPQAASGEAFEYYIEVRPAAGEPTRFPATAPDLCQTVVVEPNP